MCRKKSWLEFPTFQESLDLSTTVNAIKRLKKPAYSDQHSLVIYLKLVAKNHGCNLVDPDIYVNFGRLFGI